MAAEADLASATAAHILESKIDNNQKWSALNADGAEPFFLYLNASLAKTDSLSVVDTHELDIDATFRHFESLGMAHIECAGMQRRVQNNPLSMMLLYFTSKLGKDQRFLIISMKIV